MYRIVKYSEIDKNKWNGSVHYATQGNTFGYHWYLKSIIKEWDAVIEDDYESVWPILINPIPKELYALLPSLGPYSVNFLSPSRYQSMEKLFLSHNISANYPINHKIPSHFYQSFAVANSPCATINAFKNYAALAETYPKEINAILDNPNLDFRIGSGTKPEELVDISRLPHLKKQALLRVMYNALHRGAGFSSSIYDKYTEKIAAASFYVISHQSIHEIYASYISEHARIVQLDLLLRNQEGKPSSMFLHDNIDLALKMGFSLKASSSLIIKNSVFTQVKRMLNLSY